MKQFRIFRKVLLRERRHYSFLLLSGVVVGCLAGVVGSLFQLSIIWFTELKYYLANTFIHNQIGRYSFLILFCVVSIVVAIILVKKFAPEAAGSGVQEIEGVLLNYRKLRGHRVLPVKFIGGVLALSSGLVLGREGPTIQMSSAIGKMFSDRFRLRPEFTHAIIAAGAGAGLSVAFNAPLAGILFVIEEMRGEFRYSFMSMNCVIVASICADIVLRLIMGQKPDIIMTYFSAPPLGSLWMFVVFGCIFGCFGVIFNRYLIKTLNFFSDSKQSVYWPMIIVVGIVVGALTIFYPYAVGGGYSIISDALSYKVPIMALLLLFIIRMIATWVSYGSGTPGGIFAPMIALGTVFGMWYGQFAHYFFPELVTHPGIFAVAGMSALFTATVGAPLTGILLVTEMTMNYALILPLIITCFSATITAFLLGGNPIYETLLERTLKRVAQKRKLIKK